MIDITVLGTSALMPIPERALASVFLRCGGHSILFDCGEGTQTAARKAGVSLMKTDVIALSHYHGDHIFGLPGLLQTMNVMGRTEPLYLTGPKGLERELAPVIALVGEVSFEIRLFMIPETGLKLREMVSGFPDGAVLSAFETEHRVSSQGYVFSLTRPGKFLPAKAESMKIPKNLWSALQKGETVEFDSISVSPDEVLGEPRKGLKVVFTGDTAACDSLVENAKNADLLISEATFGESSQETLALERGHMTFRSAAEVAAAADVKSLLLLHFSPRVVDPHEYLPNAAEVFENTACAADGMSLTLHFED